MIECVSVCLRERERVCVRESEGVRERECVCVTEGERADRAPETCRVGESVRGSVGERVCVCV